MLGLRRLMPIFGVALIATLPIKANAASVTVDLLLPFFVEIYETGEDPFGDSAPGSAEVSFTLDDETAPSGGFVAEGQQLSEFSGAISQFDVTIRDSLDTSGSILGAVSLTDPASALITVGDNFFDSFPFVSEPTDLLIITIGVEEQGTGALSGFENLTLLSLLPSGTFDTAGLENFTQANLDASAQQPNVPFNDTFIPALSVSFSRTVGGLPDLNGDGEPSPILDDTLTFGNNVAAIPLPPAGLLLVAALLGLGAVRRR